MRNKRDFTSNLFSQIAHKLHPKLGQLYDNHTKFFNDGFVELVCLIIANTSIGILSFRLIGLPLVLLSLCFVTPITFSLKYFLHKLWVWAK